MTHTPGPWTISETNASGNHDDLHIFIQPGVAVIERGVDPKHDMPDAHLIAAAPELLAALSMLLSDVESTVHYGMPFTNPEHGFHESVMAARAAIAKAKVPTSPTTKLEPTPQPSEAERLVRELRSEGLRPRSYSGRGMFGKECVGVSIDRLDDLDGLPLKGVRTDSLGLGLIAYWPHLTWTDALEG